MAALKDLEEECDEILKDAEFIDKERRSALCSALRDRINLLGEIIK